MDKTIKVNLTQEQLNWLETNYKNRSQGIRECIDHSMHDQKDGNFHSLSQREKLTKELGTLSETISKINQLHSYYDYGNINCEGLAKGVSRICQILLYSKE